MQATAQKKKNGKVLDFIERVGNRLPHPYILFLWLCLILALISLACSNVRSSSIPSSLKSLCFAIATQIS